MGDCPGGGRFPATRVAQKYVTIEMVDDVVQTAGIVLESLVFDGGYTCRNVYPVKGYGVSLLEVRRSDDPVKFGALLAVQTPPAG